VCGKLEGEKKAQKKGIGGDHRGPASKICGDSQAGSFLRGGREKVPVKGNENIGGRREPRMNQGTTSKGWEGHRTAFILETRTGTRWGKVGQGTGPSDGSNTQPGSEDKAGMTTGFRENGETAEQHFGERPSQIGQRLRHENGE